MKSVKAFSLELSFAPNGFPSIPMQARDGPRSVLKASVVSHLRYMGPFIGSERESKGKKWGMQQTHFVSGCQASISKNQSNPAANQFPSITDTTFLEKG